MTSESVLEEARAAALKLEQAINAVILGQERAVRLINTALHARGHTLLEGDVGVGKTTILRAFARGIGGPLERVEGTVDLMPTDVLYHTYVDADGKPRVEPGPLVRHDGNLAVFFFNEINRARPQVQALLLRAMAERTVSAFNHEVALPYLTLFADRNQVEREETFELPAASRDRFMMEIAVHTPTDVALRRDLVFSDRFHDADRLIQAVPAGIVDFRRLHTISEAIQSAITATPALEDYALRIWQATGDPRAAGVTLEGIDLARLIIAPASPRGMSMLLRAARVSAWLAGRTYLLPEDVKSMVPPVLAHRVVLNPVYVQREHKLAVRLLDQIAAHVPAP